MVEAKEKFIIYDIDEHQKIGEFESQEICIAFLDMMLNCFDIDNFQVQRIFISKED
jgi:hypothetical protein